MLTGASTVLGSGCLGKSRHRRSAGDSWPGGETDSKQMALPCGAFLKLGQPSEFLRKLGEGTGSCGEGIEGHTQEQGPKDTERFAGIGSDGGDEWTHRI